MKYTDGQRIEKMTITTEKLLNYLDTNRISQEDILSQETIRWTITTPLYNIGEHAYALSDEYKENHPEIPWAKIAGLRHRLVHEKIWMLCTFCGIMKAPRKQDIVRCLRCHMCRNRSTDTRLK